MGNIEENCFREEAKEYAKDLWTFCQQEWDKIPECQVMELYNSMGRRTSAVIAAKGMHTKY